jgi:hypothetical protein
MFPFDAEILSSSLDFLFKILTLLSFLLSSRSIFFWWVITTAIVIMSAKTTISGCDVFEMTITTTGKNTPAMIELKET